MQYTVHIEVNSSEIAVSGPYTDKSIAENLASGLTSALTIEQLRRDPKNKLVVSIVENDQK